MKQGSSSVQKNSDPRWNSLSRKILGWAMASTITKPAGENRPVVLLGASGRLGAMVRRYWPGDVPLICHSTTDRPGFVVFDLALESEKAKAAMRGAGAVICLSGVTPARVAARGDVYSRNTELALAALSAARRAGAGRVLLASSAAVYGNVGGMLREDTECAPQNDYGLSKLAMEQAAAAHGHPVTSLRIGNVAGADAILGGWRDGMQIDQFADQSTPRRSYIGPATLANVLYGLSQADQLPDVLNVAAPGAVEMGALLDSAGLAWAPRPAPVGAIADVTLNVDALRQIVDLSPDSGTVRHIMSEWQDWQRGRAE